jgi:biotin carboxyl carrier protein
MGDRVRKGQTIMQIELMKMNINIVSPAEGVIKMIFKKNHSLVQPGEKLCLIEIL